MRQSEKKRSWGLATGLLTLALTATLALGGLVWLTRQDQHAWPDFAAMPEGPSATAPKVVSEAERDFGWRIGDEIPVFIYILQKPGTVVDTHSLTVEGSFEVKGEPAVYTRDRKDGSRLIRIQLLLQSFEPAKQLDLKSTMLYRDLATGKDTLITLPAFAPYTSPTWDGRKLIQEGQLHVIYWEETLKTGALIILGLAGAIWLFCLSGKWRQEDEKSSSRPLRGWAKRRLLARRRFDAVWLEISKGDYDEEHYREVARIIRQLFLIESSTLSEVFIEMGDGHPYRSHAMAILEVTDEVLLRGRLLSDHQHNLIQTRFDEIVGPLAKLEREAYGRATG